MKKILQILFLLLLIYLSQSLYGYDDHVYINGKVINFSSNTITIDTSKYVYFISDKVKVVKHVKKKNSIYEEPASLKELKLSKSVTLKVTGNIVHEIIIEEYKK